MANSKISELANAILPIGDNDIFPIVQNSETRKVPFSAIKGLSPIAVEGAVDLNTYTSTGLYEISGNNAHVNTPRQHRYSFVLVVLKAGRGIYDYDSIMQLYFARGRMYFRNYDTAQKSWGEWIDLIQRDYVTLNTEQTITASKTFTAYCDFQAGAGNSGSDMRFKRNVHPLEDVSERVKKLDVIEYDWIKQGEEKHTFGLNATQVKELFPLICHERPDNEKTQWLEYDRVGVIALKAIQEQQQRIEALETELAELKNIVKQMNR